MVLVFGGCASHDRRIAISADAPSGIASNSPFPRLKNNIDELLAGELHPHSIAAIKIISLDSGETFYETNSRLLLSPASNQKVFTAAAALSLLGPDHRMETSVALDRSGSTIYLKGCGDPLLDAEDLSVLAGEIAVKMPTKVPYALSADTSCFDDIYWGSGWMWDDEPEPEEMYLSALSVNGNAITVALQPGVAESSPLSVTTHPQTRYVTVANTSSTAKAGGPCTATISRRPGDRDNLISVGGLLAPGCAPVAKRLSVWKPELYALTLFAEQLAQQGIAVSSLKVAAAPPDAIRLRTMGRPVRKVVSAMLKQSDNLCAENVLKYLGRSATGREGSAASGIALLTGYLQSRGVPAAQLRIADGSGVSRYNLATAESIVRLLEATYRDPAIFGLFSDALPVAGIDGTLARRMQGTPAEGKVRAKTGSMKGVEALSGYAVTADGERLAFSMLMQHFTGPSQSVRDLQDRIAVLLSSFHRSDN